MAFKRGIFFRFLLLLPLTLFSQPDLAWSWIQSGQTYIRMEVWVDGIYRASPTQLVAAGYPGNIPVDQLKVFCRGEEQAIYVEDANSNSLFDGNDFIEFWGARNDGGDDAQLYKNPQTNQYDASRQPNSYLSLFSDTSIYYLTWSPPQGKRLTPFFLNNYSAYSPESFYQTYSHINLNLSNWVAGGPGALEAENSEFVTGEGYYDLFPVQFGNPRTHLISYPGAVLNSGRNWELQIRVFGFSIFSHALAFQFGNFSSFNHYSQGITLNTISQTGLMNTLSGSQASLTTQALYAPTDNNYLSWIRLYYDRNFQLGGLDSTHVSRWSSVVNRYWKFTQVNSTLNDLPVVYDFTLGYRITGTPGNGQMEFIVPGSNLSRELYVSHSGVARTPVIRAVNFRKLADWGGAPYIIITDRSLSFSAQQMLAFRQNSQRNPQACVIVYTDEIYDEFGYGSVTPLAIRRFLQVARTRWQTKPEYVLLWGKGMHETIRRNTRLPYTENKVPTFGFPASDQLLVTPLDTSALGYLPQLSIGRVNIYTDPEGQDYLLKLQQYEQSTWDGTWMKEAVHLGGGETAGEQSLINGYLTGRFLPIWQDAPWGGRVLGQQKSNGTLPSASVTEIQNKINQGVGLISFFGHSTNNIFDIDIREASEYTNIGKYPLVIANGCYGGNFSTVNKTFGERFLLERDRGSIAWIASSGLGYIVYLGELTKNIYEVLYRDSIGVPLGKSLVQAQQRLYGFGCNAPSTCPVTLNHLRQTNLQGDPALILHFPKNPDYEITEAGVKFDPDPFTSRDSFKVKLGVRNLGKAVPDSVPVTLHQQILSGPLQGEVWNQGTRNFSPITYADTLSFQVPFREERSAGLNRFSIWIDSSRILDDSNYANNSISINKIIPGNAPAILYPFDFAIIPQAQVKLSASSFNMSKNAAQRYEFALDTSWTFSSPAYQSSGILTGSSCYMEWTVPFSLQEGQVYYWRVRLPDESQSTWASASFQYRPSVSGWAQSALPQYQNNLFEGLTPDLNQNAWKFDSLSASINIITNTGGNARFNFNGIKVSNNDNHPTVVNGIWFSHIGGDNLSIQSNHPQYGSWTWYPIPSGISSLTQAIQQVPANDWVILCSQFNAGISSWVNNPNGEALYQAIENLGSASIRSIPDAQPFILAGRKGSNLGSAYEVVQSPWQLSATIKSGNTRGTIRTRSIGPAIQWNQANMKWVGDNSDDSLQYSLMAVTKQSIDSSLVIPSSSNSVQVDLSTINSALYPSLKFAASLSDGQNRTPPNQQNWEVIYAPAGDAIADAARFFSLEPSPVAEGKMAKIRIQVSNYTNVPLDSITIRYRVLRTGNPPIELGSKKFASLPAASSILTEFEFNSIGMGGQNTLIVEVNPDLILPELYLFNNYFYYPFFVDGDNQNPLLDITFDGRRLMDGEVVSPKPEIVITSKDNNPVFPIDSLGCFRISYRTENGADSVVVLENNSQISFSPGILPQNRARLKYQPGPLVDGDYTLRVQGFDKVGNAAGGQPYEIRFKVINENTITPIFNYPNPFSTRTKFVFTLTGKDMPSIFRLEIYTITGRLIRRMDLRELGLVHIGQNLNGFEWDGTDDYGDRLANGVYLYKAVIRYPDGTEPKLREASGLNHYFNNGFGKLVIFR